MNLKTMPAVLLTALVFAACGGSTETSDTTSTPAPPADAPEVVYLIDADATTITWKGTMLGIKSHHGQVRATDGKVALKGDQIVAGKFIVDLNSIMLKDQADYNYDAEGSKKNTESMLTGHLKSGDFFDVENHPTASLHILEHNGDKAAAELTIRGISSPESIRDIKLVRDNGVLTATGTLTFDRQKYGVAWSSGMKDAVLSDNIELEVNIVARAEAL